MLGWIRLTGEDPVQLVEVLPGVRGYADLREGMLRLIVIDGQFERDFFDWRKCCRRAERSLMWGQILG
ncbi:MAG: hypothetical protein ACKO3T_09920, partial [Planctomycetaceae bacterium]